MIGNSEVKKRFRETVLKYAIILLIGVAYLIFVRCTGIGIPCLFYEITGLKCVGCGISRMLVSLSRLDFVTAFQYNSFLFITGPFILLYLAICEVRYVFYGSAKMGKWGIFLWVELVLAIVYAVLRNIFSI